MYTIHHSYLTIGDDDQPTVDVETRTWDGTDIDEIALLLRRMIEHPGGRSGTTVSLTVSLAQPTSL